MRNFDFFLLFPVQSDLGPLCGVIKTIGGHFHQFYKMFTFNFWFSRIYSLSVLFFIISSNDTLVNNMAEYIYSAIKPRITLVSEPVLKIELKDPIFYLDKSCIIYRFNCFCDRSYIGHTARHLKSRVIEHIPKCVKKFIEDKTNIKTTAKLNATRRSSISEQLSQ